MEINVVDYHALLLDPFELQNRYSSLNETEKTVLHDTLVKLVACRGRSCTLSRHLNNVHHQLGDSITHLSRGNKRKHTSDGMC